MEEHRHRPNGSSHSLNHDDFCQIGTVHIRHNHWGGRQLHENYLSHYH